MAKTDKRKTFFWQAYKPLLATALAATGIFNMANAVLAAGTAADTDISNTATATYEDGSGNPPINVESNTVIIKVAEIAGLTAVPRPIEDSTPGTPVEPGDTLTFSFDVTNVGNAPTDVFVPGINDLGLDNFVPSATTPVQVFEADGTTLIGTIDPAGGTLSDAAGSPVTIAPDQVFVVKVTGTPDPVAVDGDTIGVTLGDTTDNTDEGPNPTQNQADDTDAGSLPNDLRTVDTDPTQSPTNGEREAEAISSTTLEASPLALAKILKTSAIASTGVPSNPTDDLISYSLDLEVDDVDPSGNFQPADLAGTSINLDSSAQTLILVSDAIPAETALSSVDNVPAGWTAVFTTDAGTDSLSLNWQTLQPTTDLATVTRLGFVFNGTVAQGISVNGFDFTVVTSGVTSTTGTTIENVAQVFGQTFNDPTDQIIYDESGDDNPNNFDDGGTPPDPDGSDYDPVTDTGIAPESDGDGDNIPDNPGDVDGGNNNTGTGPDGETNVVPLIPATDDIVTGPLGASAATGPSGTTEDDFTNQSTPVPAGLAPADTFDPAAVVFDNSLTNPAANFIANVVVEPISPAEAAAASGQPQTAYEGTTPIPTGTEVTISDGTNTALYTFDGTTFNTTDTPISFGDVNPAQVVDYTVTVDLPTGSAQLAEVSIPLVAFPDTNAAGFDVEPVSNITIDRLYTGFMSLIKESQIRSADGATILEAFTQSPTAEAAPDQIIDYRLSYENISSPLGASTGSITLDATNFVILEDGNAGTNNWAQFTTHKAGATATAGTINYFTNSADAAPVASSPTDPVDGTPAEKYTNEVPSIAPGVTGTFDFSRTVD